MHAENINPSFTRPRWVAIAIGVALIASLSSLAYVESGGSVRQIVVGPSEEQKAAAARVPSGDDAVLEAPKYAEDGAALAFAEDAVAVLQATPPSLTRAEAADNVAGLKVLDAHEVSFDDGTGWLQARLQTPDGRLLLLSLQQLNGDTVDLASIDENLNNYEQLADGTELAWYSQELTSFFVVVKNDQRLAVAIEGEPFNPENASSAWTLEELRAIVDTLVAGLLK